MLLGVGGCVFSPLLYATGAVLVPAVLNPDLVPSTEQEGGAWFIEESNEPNMLNLEADVPNADE